MATPERWRFGLHRVEGDLQSQSGGDSTDRAKALDGIVPHPAKGGFMPKVLIPGFLTLGQAAPLGYDPAQPAAAPISPVVLNLHEHFAFGAFITW